MKTRYIIVLVPMLLMGCSNNDATQQLKQKLIGDPKAERVVKVGIQPIDVTDGIVRNTYPGSLQEGQSLDLSFKYGGIVEAINVKEGARVYKGQVLARVSSPSMESTLRSAQATLDQADDAYQRLKKVYDNGSLPEIKWREMVANREKAQSAVDLANAMLMENTLTAPFSGTVSAVNVELGENVTPMKPAIRIISTRELSVKISVPESEIQAIRIGSPAEVEVPALGRSYTGKVVEKGLSASLLTHSYPVKIHIDQPDADLVPDMIAKVMLQSDVSTGIIVPANAVLINNDGKFVWVAEEGRATRRPVVINGYSGKGVVISEGLQAGDSVIVEGYQKVSEGMRVSGEWKVESGK